MQRIVLQSQPLGKIAIGRAWRYHVHRYQRSEREVPVAARDAEQHAFEQAVAATRDDLRTLAQQNDIFAAHLELLEDPMLEQRVSELIAEGRCATDAVSLASDELSALFDNIDDEYLRARADDVRDVCRRVLQHLLPQEHNALSDIPEGAILLAEELAPSDTVHIDFQRVAGVITRCGSVTSHLAILARNLGVVAVVGLGDDYDTIADDEQLIIDGKASLLLCSPDDEVLRNYTAQLHQDCREEAEAQRIAAESAVMRSGEQIAIYANAGSVEEVQRAMTCGAEGIGLFRSEFLYMQQSQFPSEQTQAQIYSEAAKCCRRGPLTIRTLDIGGDKALPYYTFPKEENPFLGWRAIRFTLELRDIFRTQLRAILRASAVGRVRIMFPMIISLDELRDAKALLRTCMDELRAEGVPFDEQIAVGVMVETPSAVWLADELAAEVDFFSLGTNDLTQYLLCVDRGNTHISALYDSLHPAVVRAIRQVADAAHRHHCEVGICGEFAANPAHTALLVGLGLDELSVASSQVAKVKQQVRATDSTEARALAQRALKSSTVAAIHALIEKQTQDETNNR